ncbi:MAG: DUF2760 domain-containing protein, partial [Methylococcales bacterium]|nr:DUF2760 domain-containing protein [Methylococcales bacterium]
MNKNYAIDLSLMPSTFDLWHVYLIATVIILALILIVVLIVMAISMSRQAKKNAQQAADEKMLALENSRLLTLVAVPPVAETKIVEKIVEVEKIVQAPIPEPVILKESTPDAALQVLSLLQKEARFIDFIKEDISNYSDADIGIAARVVHEGCHKAVNEYFTLSQVRKEGEGDKVTLEKGFNASEVRLT